MARTTTETMGVCERVLEFMKANRAELTSKGVNVDLLESALSTENDDFTREEAKQESMKAALREQTAKVTTAKSKVDKRASDTIRIVAGALGTDTELGEQAAQLSVGLRRPRRAEASAKSPAS